MTPIKRNQNLVDRLKGVRNELTKLHVYTADEDKPVEVAVIPVRQKWQRVMDVLDEMQWTRVEALDKKGAVLLVHNRGPGDERPAGDIEDLTTSTGEAGKVSSLLAVAVHWVVRAQDAALTRQQDSMSSVLEAHARLVDSTMRRFEQMDRQYNEMLRLNHAMHGQRFAEVERMIAAAQQQTEGADDSSDKLIQELLPSMVKAAMAKPELPKAPNGAPPKAGK